MQKKRRATSYVPAVLLGLLLATGSQAFAQTGSSGSSGSSGSTGSTGSSGPIPVPEISITNSALPVVFSVGALLVLAGRRQKPAAT